MILPGLNGRAVSTKVSLDYSSGCKPFQKRERRYLPGHLHQCRIRCRSHILAILEHVNSGLAERF